MRGERRTGMRDERSRGMRDGRSRGMRDGKSRGKSRGMRDGSSRVGKSHRVRVDRRLRIYWKLLLLYWTRSNCRRQGEHLMIWTLAQANNTMAMLSLEKQSTSRHKESISL